MSSITTYCPTCGSVLDPQVPGLGAACPQCSTVLPPVSEPQPRLWGAGTGFLVWLVSAALTLGVPLILGLAYLIAKMFRTGRMPTAEDLTGDLAFVLVTTVATLPAHLLTLLICWLVVTSRGRRPFLQTIEWGRPTALEWVYAIGLGFLMMAAAIVFEKLLPHRETDLEKLLNLGYSVRVSVAALAVLTAPLVEEVVYRGVLYSGIERSWGKGAAIVVVAFLFAGVHAPQYWGSVAALTAISTLSVALTLLRAATGKLMPCVVAHLVFNGIQAMALLVAPENATNNQ